MVKQDDTAREVTTPPEGQIPYQFYGDYGTCLGIQITLKCPLRCGHCIVDSHPLRNEDVDSATAVDWVIQAHDYGIRTLAVTGGEPFLNKARLRAMARVALRHTMNFVVVTSSNWASKRERARKTLEGLNGITHLCLSTDKWHLEFVPLENVINAAQAALELGIEAAVYLCLESPEDPFQDYFDLHFPDSLHGRVKVFSQYVHAEGRASGLLNILSRTSLNRLPDWGCTIATVPMILPDGTITACCGDNINDPARWAPLTLGNIYREPLTTILDRGRHRAFIHALRTLGPKRIAILTRGSGMSTKFSRLYETNNICDICRDLATDPEVMVAVDELMKQGTIRSAIATHRAVIYGETDMLDELESDRAEEQADLDETPIVCQ